MEAKKAAEVKQQIKWGLMGVRRFLAVYKATAESRKTKTKASRRGRVIPAGGKGDREVISVL